MVMKLFWKTPEGITVIITGILLFGFLALVVASFIIPLHPNVLKAEDQIIPPGVELTNFNQGCWDNKYKAWYDCNKLEFYPSKYKKVIDDCWNQESHSYFKCDTLE